MPRADLTMTDDATLGHVGSSDLFGVAVPERGAVLSACRRYRYTLWRRWADGPACMFVGLNPSTADAELDDPLGVLDWIDAAMLQAEDADARNQELAARAN